MGRKKICDECTHRPTCALPCRPVELYLAKGNLALYERTFRDAGGRLVTVIHTNAGRYDKEVRQSSMKKSDRAEDKFTTFSTEAENPFVHFNPELKQTGIFIDRLIRRMSLADLVVKYDLKNEAAARDKLRETVNRLYTLLQLMDQRKHKAGAARRMKKIGTLPKINQWFLMSRILNMTHTEIADFEGRSISTICSGIKRVHDQLAAGEKDLILFSPEEKRTGKINMEKWRRRERRRQRRKNK